MTDQLHALEVVGPGPRRERVELESKSVLVHDFLHYAVETEAGLQDGFWGQLAAGCTLAALNDRTGESMKGAHGPLLQIERIVGAMSGAVKGRSAAEMYAGFEAMAAALNEPLPAWLDEALIIRVQERMRQLLGHWKATPYGGTMALGWHSDT